MPSSASISPFKTRCPFFYSFFAKFVEFHRKRMKNKFCYPLQRAGHSQNECLWAWLQPGVYYGSAPPPLLRHYPRLLNVASELWSPNTTQKNEKLSQDRAFWHSGDPNPPLKMFWFLFLHFAGLSRVSCLFLPICILLDILGPSAILGVLVRSIHFSGREPLSWSGCICPH